MDLNDYDERTPLNTDINPRASQAVAARKRAVRQEEDAPVAPARPQHQLIAGIVGALAVLGVLALAISQHGSGPHARPLAIPTDTPAQAFDTNPKTSHQASPAFTPAPQPTIPPLSTPVPAEAVLVAPVPPMVGRGLTVDAAAPTPAPPPPELSYVAIVGAQAVHSPRGGLCGPTGGDCAPGVPYGLDNAQYIANVGAQVPHKVR